MAEKKSLNYRPYGLDPIATKKRDPLFYFLKWLLIIAIAFTTLVFVSGPLRAKWAQNYIGRGDAYLAQKRYLSATLEYRKATLLYEQNKKSAERTDLVSKSMTNILQLEDFFKEKNIGSELEQFAKAKAVPKNEIEALKTTKVLFDADEYQLSAVIARTATEMDKTYTDAWVYLGIAEKATCEYVELSKKAKETHCQASDAAFRQAKMLDPENATVKEYLK